MRVILLNFLVMVMVGCGSCGGGGGGGGGGGVETGNGSLGGSGSSGVETGSGVMYLASNVILRSASASQGSSVGKVLDTETQVEASSIVVSKDSNALESENLQEALDAELAVSLVDSINGEWVVSGTDGVEGGRCNFGESGSISYTGGSCLTFGARVYVSVGASYVCSNPLRYRVLSNSIVLVDYDAGGVCGGTLSGSLGVGTRVYLVTEMTARRLVMLDVLGGGVYILNK